MNGVAWGRARVLEGGSTVASPGGDGVCDVARGPIVGICLVGGRCAR